eukprot:Nitzschia sp. Nitz4//scaffold75_size92586//3848//6839//NITZ4_004837-RA/size92586-augustus-gene-0.86-mRNA-1//-1//CDS//3329557651//3284//frame0
MMEHLEMEDGDEEVEGLVSKKVVDRMKDLDEPVFEVKRKHLIGGAGGLMFLLLLLFHGSSSSGDPLANQHPASSPVESSVESPVGSSVESPVESPATPTSAPTTGGTAAPTDSSGDINRYSKFATYHPLMNLPLPDADTAAELAEQWGKWHFFDGDELDRPMDDFLAKYPNRDCPAEEFPDTAWQVDAVYVNHYLDSAGELVSRAMEAILAEYGHPKEGATPEELVDRLKQFHWDIVNITSDKEAPEQFRKRGSRGNGGWTTQRSQDGLVRRLLHAMMTSDKFTVVLGGHSAASGAGNHFRQNYMMQFHKIMAPIFARLGIKLVTHNFSMGGLGSLHSTLGMSKIYGDDIDLLLWDTGMTEGKDHKAIDLFIRQGLLGGKRIPVIWGSELKYDIFKLFHEEADVDIGEYGLAQDNLPVITSPKQIESLPWAARYMKCADAVETICTSEPRFCVLCWEEREDGIEPETKQRDAPRGQVSWHPGWRVHQLVGRNLAFAVLRALQTAIDLWVDEVYGGPPLADEEWHVTDYYENTRSKLLAMNETLGWCHEYADNGLLPQRICTTAMKGATQHTPRYRPTETSITSMLKPAPNGYVPRNTKELLFEGPDPPIPCMEIPEGQVDVYAIVTGRRRLEQESVWNFSQHLEELVEDIPVSTRSLDTGIVPGIGWEVAEEPAGYCDGAYDSICSRDGGQECVLLGAHSFRGFVVGNEYAGWLVLNVPAVKEGIIVLKLETWHEPDVNPRTKGWTTVNNEGGFTNVDEDAGNSTRVRRRMTEGGERNAPRSLASVETTPQPDDMVFEYAVDGAITTLPRDEFLEKLVSLQRVVHTLTILDDPNYTSEPRDVEVAIRMRNCGTDCTFGLSHIYWA